MSLTSPIWKIFLWQLVLTSSFIFWLCSAHDGCETYYVHDFNVPHLTAYLSQTYSHFLGTGFSGDPGGYSCQLIIYPQANCQGLVSITSFFNQSSWTLHIYTVDPLMVLPDSAEPLGKYTCTLYGQMYGDTNHGGNRSIWKSFTFEVIATCQDS